MSFLLDQFPLDILFMIFDYLWAHEILYSFLNISNYLNSILSSHKKYMINFESISKSKFDLVCLYMRPEQVISLILSDKVDTINQSELFECLFSIEQFTRLRSLKLIKLDNDDGELFLSDLYKLKHLLSLEINVKIRVPFLIIPPSLERLVINIDPQIHYDIYPLIATIRFHHLRSLSLSNCSCKTLKKIFSEAVGLTSLKISMGFSNPEELDAFINIHHKQPAISSLTSLSVFIEGAGKYKNNRQNHLNNSFILFLFGHTIMFDHIEGFLSLFNFLKQLELSIHITADRQLTDAHRWEKFIIKYLPKLVIFNFKFCCWRLDENIIDQYRRPFWLDKHWYVVGDSDYSSIFTVPHFAPTSTSSACEPIPSNHTTLPIEQHSIFYDSIIELRLDSDQKQLPYRYNYVKKIYLESSYINETILDLSKVQLLVVNTHELPPNKLLTFIKQSMPSVNHLSLHIPYFNMRDKDLPNISLEQIRNLGLPKFGMIKDTDPYNWSRLFPCVEQLHVAINSKNQIKYLLHQFQHLANGYFHLDTCYADRKIKIHINDQWLEKQINRFREKKIKNFTSQIDERFTFSVCLWISGDDGID